MMGRKCLSFPVVIATTVLGLSAPAMADTAKKVYDFNHSIGADGDAGVFTYSQHATMMSYAGIKILGDAWDSNPADLDPVMVGTDNKLVLLTPYTTSGTTTSVNQIKAFNTRWGPNRILAIRGPNEPNNFQSSYNGNTCGTGHSDYHACAQYMKDLYTAIRADSSLNSIMVAGVSEPGNDSADNGIQFTTIPGSHTTSAFAAGTQFSDWLDIHDYENDDNQWPFCETNPTCGDDVVGNHGPTAWGGFSGPWGYSLSVLPTIPRISSETGTQTGAGTTKQAQVALSSWLDHFYWGWQASLWFNIAASPGFPNYGLFDSSATARTAAVWMHNQSIILADASGTFTPGTISNTATGGDSTTHNLLMQKSDGSYWWAVWREADTGSSNVTLNFGSTVSNIQTWDPTVGTAAQNTVSSGSSLAVSVTNHPIFVSFNGSAPAEALTVNSIPTQNASTAFTVSGAYSGSPAPANLDYKVDAGSYGAVTSTISGGTWSFTEPGIAGAGSHTISVRDRTNTGVTATSNSFTVTAAETLAINPIPSETVNAPFTVSGTYNGSPSPAALDYSLNSGSTWTAASSPTISGGNYSFSITIASTNASQTVMVRDHTNTGVTATSNTFAVNAIATGYPAYDHVVVVWMENKSNSEVVGVSAAPYYNGTLIGGGAYLSNVTDHGIHPSEPNYVREYAGYDNGVTDDLTHVYADPSLWTVEGSVTSGFTGFEEATVDNPYKHAIWHMFPEGTAPAKDFTANFPTTAAGYAALPKLSWVIPNDNDNWHTGTIMQGDQWLQANIDGYAQWAKTHNSLLVVVVDEDDSGGTGTMPMVLYGANVQPRTDTTLYDHYSLLNLYCLTTGVAESSCPRAGGATSVPTRISTANFQAQTTAESITVVTPGTQTTNVAFTLSGGYTGTPAPTAFDYTLNGGSTWTAASSPTISASNYSFSVTVTTANSTQQIGVRDHNHTTVTATTNAFAVNAPVPSGTAQTWNSSHKSSNVTLSNGNLTASHSGTDSVDGQVYGTVGESSANRYWEATVQTKDCSPSNERDSIGIGNSSGSTTSWLGSDNTSFGITTLGSAYTGGSWISTFSGPGYCNGQNVGLALDNTHHKIWYRVNGGNWNGSGTDNPATNAGGLSVSNVTGALFPAASTYYTTGTVSAFTLKINSSDWTYTAPSGFGSWNAAAVGHTLVVTLAEDTYAGASPVNAQATITIDGANITGNPFTVTAAHSTGGTQAVTIPNVADGAHTIAVSYPNNSTCTTGPELWVTNVTYDGVAKGTLPQKLGCSTGSISVTVP